MPSIHLIKSRLSSQPRTTPKSPATLLLSTRKTLLGLKFIYHVWTLQKFSIAQGSQLTVLGHPSFVSPRPTQLSN